MTREEVEADVKYFSDIAPGSPRHQLGLTALNALDRLERAEGLLKRWDFALDPSDCKLPEVADAVAKLIEDTGSHFAETEGK